MVRALTLLSLTLALAACSADDEPVAKQPRDPAVEQALNDPLMTDPDLSSRNEGAAALTVNVDGALPVLEASPEAIASARAEASALLGGTGAAVSIPAPRGTIAPLGASHSPADHLAVLADKTSCKAPLRDSTIWAARLPAALPVYPRGATVAATGGDGKACRVAAVVFSTPIPVDEVVAFYWRRARIAGLAPVTLTADDTPVLQGRGKGVAFDLRAHETDGGTIVELATVSG